MCEFCGPNDSDCSVCRDRHDQQHRDRQRNFSRVVSVVTFSLLVLIATVAAVCGLVNKLNHH